MSKYVRLFFNRKKKATAAVAGAIEIVVCLQRERCYFHSGHSVTIDQWENGLVETSAKLRQKGLVIFGDLQMQRRKVKSEFFNQINAVIDWHPLRALIEAAYAKGFSPTGRPCYDCMVLFRMELMRTWYGLSDSPALTRRPVGSRRRASATSATNGTV